MPAIKVDPNGEFEVEQMYVQYVKLAQPKARVPLLLWHGGGLSGVTWETKPDGKPGWQQYFPQRRLRRLRLGRGRARPRLMGALSGDLQERTESSAPRRRRGSCSASGRPTKLGGKRVAHEGQQFPVEALDAFMKQGVPRWVTNDAATQKAYDALVQKVCPCIIVVHSQGGNFGFNAALKAPDKVKALIAVEPSGAPDPAKAEAAKVKGVPLLVVWGDFIDKQRRCGRRIRPNPEKWAAAIKAAGGTVDTFDLPVMGIKGNTHMLMMDRNSDDIAKLVHDWIGKQGLVN